MHWIPDHTGRFRLRPYFPADEIDALSERRVERFLRERHGHVRYPMHTDELTLLIEQEADDLDLFAHLPGSAEPARQNRTKVSRA